MKKHLERVSTVGMAYADWQKFQLKRIGGSSTSAILGLNPWMSAIEAFYYYIGDIPQKSEENESMLFGTLLEPIVAKQWEYFDTDGQTMVRNFREGKKTQQCRKVNAIITNPAYPHLHANIDREIIRSRDGRRGILEIKTISGYSADRYEAGIPISYVIQLHHYMLVCEESYGEIAFLKDGRQMEVIPFERNDNICLTIIQKTTEFWKNVEAARRILKWDQLTLETRQAAIAELEPPVDDSKSYEEFLKKRYRTPDVDAQPIEATVQHYEWVKGYKHAGAHITKWEKEQQYYKNQLIKEMADKEVIDFGGAGKVTYRANDKGSRILRVGVKLPEEVTV